MSEKDRPLSLINVGVAIVLILAVVIMIGKWQRCGIEAPQDVVKPQQTKIESETVEPPVYSLENIKAQDGRIEKVRAGDMKEAYEKFPKASAGGNLVAGWSKVSPKDKAKIREALDKDIESSREKIKQNPEDEKAAHLLKISEMLKLVVTKDFNIGPEDYTVMPKKEEPAKDMQL